jgi:hypothetical protein
MAVTETTLNFVSRFDNSGATQAVQGNQNVGKSISDLGNQAANSQIKMDGLFRRMERPLSALVFSGMADDIVNLGQKGESATVMLEKGFHAVGMALTDINPMWGAEALGAGALFDIFEKMNHQKTAEEIQKQTGDLEKLTKSYSDAADVLLKHGVITKTESDQLKGFAEANKQATDAIINKAKAEEIAARINMSSVEGDIIAGKYQRDGLVWDQKRTEAKKRYADAVKAVTGLTEHFNAIDAQKPAQSEEDEISAISQKASDIYQVHFQWWKKELKAKEDHDAAMTEEEQKLGQELLGKSESFFKDFVSGNQKNLDKDLANWIDSYATKLFAAATADAFIDPLKAVGEFAGATALFALSGTFGGGGGGAAPSSASGSGSSAGSNPGTGTTVPGTNLTFVFQGGDQLSNSFMAQFLSRQNAFVQNSNGMVVATHAVTQSGQIVSIGS